MVKVRVHGLERLLRKLGKLPPDLEDVMRVEVKVAAVNIQSGARRRAPVDTGRLRNSITHEISPDGLNARVGSNVNYAGYVEHGTRRMAARPYLFPACEQERPRYRARVRKALRKAMRDVAG